MSEQTTVINSEGFMRLPQILKVFPVGRSTWWAGVKSGRFPKPVKLGANTTAWKASEIKALIDRYQIGWPIASFVEKVRRQADESGGAVTRQRQR